MRLARAADIRRLDERAEREFGIPRILLMENAGLSVVLAMERVFGSLEGKRVVVFCGKGGNGGDGMCAARHLVSHGAEIVVGLVGSREELEGETKSNHAILDRMGMTPREVKGDSDLPWVSAAASASDFVIDALLGTGSRLPVTGIMSRIIRAVNACGKPVVSVDIPSGLDCDTGKLPGDSIVATLTVTLALPKRGQVLHPGTMCIGKLVTADLTMPPALLNDPGICANVLLPEEVVQLMPRRSPQAHKYDAGRVLIIAGSRSMTGAAILSGSAALAGGAGMVYLAVPASAAVLLHGRVPELIIRPQADTPAGNLSEAAVEDLLAASGQMQAVALGPGLGTEETTKRAIVKLLGGISVPMVADADALNALSQNPDALKEAKGPRILTPHSGEMARLLGITAEAVEADRLGSASRCAEKYAAITVLKGARTVVAEPPSDRAGPEGRQFVVPTGNAGMATAGTGDVLTGVIAAFLAAGLPALSAALLGAYAHGLAGDLARDAKTELALTASDITEHLPGAFRKIAAGGRKEAGTA